MKIGKLELVDIIKIFAYFVYFKQKELIDKDITEVKEKFLKGMNKSVIHSKYCKVTPNVSDVLFKKIAFSLY